MSDSIDVPKPHPLQSGAYPHARRVGNLLFLSGIGPRTPGSNSIPGNAHAADGSLASYDIAAQCQQVFANVRAVLAASGARLEDLVDVTVYLTDMARDFKTYNAIWAEHFPDPSCAPCRTTLGITALPTPIAIELAVHQFGHSGGPLMLPAPFNFQQWIEDNRHLLPTAGWQQVHGGDGDFIIMIVGGPNARTDYHVDEGPEFFHQIEGEMVLRIQEDGAVRDIPIPRRRDLLPATAHPAFATTHGRRDRSGHRAPPPVARTGRPAVVLPTLQRQGL